MAYLAQKTI